MDPVNPIAGNPEALNQTPTAPPEPIKESPKPEVKAGGNMLTVVAMALFILLTLSAVAFLYYQNQQLKGMLSDYQTVSSPTPTVTVDPTANWETYTNSQYGFSFRYPEMWKEANLSAENMGKGFRLETDKGEFINGVVFDEKGESSNDLAWSKNISLGGEKVLLLTYTDNLGPGSKGGTIDIKIFNQILSTFKLLDPTPTSKACTMEAKICPDGSSVGRSGPNCEFSACP